MVVEGSAFATGGVEVAGPLADSTGTAELVVAGAADSNDLSFCCSVPSSRPVVSFRSFVEDVTSSAVTGGVGATGAAEICDPEEETTPLLSDADGVGASFTTFIVFS